MERLPSDQVILDGLRQGDLKIFKQLFDGYYVGMVRFALKLTNRAEIAEEIVLDIFEHLWQRKELLEIHHSISSYLYTSVRYQCINYLKSKIQHVQLVDDISNLDQPDNLTPHEALVFNDLQKALLYSIETLPDQCRAIFNLSRHAGLSNHEIAEQLGLSPKTVENQITIALKKIREFLQNNWYIFFLFFFGGKP